jgi:hypothetical protein
MTEPSRTMKDPPMADAPLSPALLQTVETALDPYRTLLPPATLDLMRRELITVLTTHPYPAALLRQLNPPTVLESGDPSEQNGSAPGPVQGKRGGR